jgi:hypothetical protein
MGGMDWISVNTLANVVTAVCAILLVVKVY